MIISYILRSTWQVCGRDVPPYVALSTHTSSRGLFREVSREQQLSGMYKLSRAVPALPHYQNEHTAGTHTQRLQRNVRAVEVVVEQPVHGGHVFCRHHAQPRVADLRGQLEVLEVALHGGLRRQRGETSLLSKGAMPPHSKKKG
jgi:hypothetical protein